MEKLTNSLLLDKEKLISEAFAEKKGRESFGSNPFTCYVKVNSPRPDLACLTGDFLEELVNKKQEAYVWTKEWDKSVVSIAPGQDTGCELLEAENLRGKLFVPVATNKAIDTMGLVANLPAGEMAMIGINSQPMTIDAFLIVYFHLINELIWDTALVESGGERVSSKSYGQAVDLVADRGFSVRLLSELDMLETRHVEPKTSMRIYGSQVNKYVPRVMGIVIKK